VLVSGDRYPASLLPAAAEQAGAEVGLALVAPTPAQLARRGWLTHSLSAAATAVARDGMVYVLVPPLARTVARRRLRASGLELTAPLAQLPARAPRHLLPVHERPWQYMLEHEIGAHPRVRRALSAVESLPAGDRLLAEWLPGTAVLGRRPDAAPLADWLRRLDGQTHSTAHVAAQTSWRGPAGSVVLFCFGPGEATPWGIAKVGAESGREAKWLERFGTNASAAGAAVPRLLASGAIGAHPVLVESAVAGRPAARALMAAPARFADVADRLAAWLVRWSGTTARRGQLPSEWLEREVARLELPAGYRQWLADRRTDLAGTAVPLVAAHNDLTMWNVRLGPDSALGILDWAEAESESLPLTDLFYAVADAAAACDGYRDRIAAARSCFEPGGSRTATIGPLTERAIAALSLSPAAADLCFHACWLRHAANERATDGADGPFAEIVRWLAHRAETS
jgi:hypothetical protein